MKKQYDELRFELCYPYEEKEKWAVDYEKPGIHGLKIFVNGKELNALLIELEDKENGDGEHTDPAEVYGHNCLGIALYEFQSHVRDPDGVLLCCCAQCACDGCNDVRAQIYMGSREVVWHHFKQSHVPYTYGGLELHFERHAYDAQIRKLEEWAKQYEY